MKSAKQNLKFKSDEGEFCFEDLQISSRVKLSEWEPEHQRAKLDLSFLNFDVSAMPSNLILVWAALDYAFDELQLIKVSVEISSADQNLIETARRLGFSEEGRLSRHMKKNDQFLDVILLAHFAETWNKKKKYAESFVLAQSVGRQNEF